jgi:hypothetical protein
MIEDYTNDDAQYQAAIAFREAAIADGWDAKPTYGASEPMESACTLEREGFKCSVLARVKPPGRYKYEAGVSIWGPDRLCIRAPKVYDWAIISGSLRKCGYCHATDVETERVGFAGRCCQACLPRVQKQVETPGWCD